MAGFDSGSSVGTGMAACPAARLSQPGRRVAIPASFRYALAVSRRTPVASSIRRSVQPSLPSATTSCFFSFLKTFLTLTEGNPHAMLNVLGSTPLAGFQVILIGRFWVIPEDAHGAHVHYFLLWG